jgi:hypothetical protein
MLFVKTILFGKKLSKNVKTFVNICGYLEILPYFSSTVACFAGDKTNAPCFFEPKATNTFPSFSSHRSIFGPESKSALSFITKHFCAEGKNLPFFSLSILCDVP